MIPSTTDIRDVGYRRRGGILLSSANSGTITPIPWFNPNASTIEIRFDRTVGAAFGEILQFYQGASATAPAIYDSPTELGVRIRDATPTPGDVITYVGAPRSTTTTTIVIAWRCGTGDAGPGRSSVWYNGIPQVAGVDAILNALNVSQDKLSWGGSGDLTNVRIRYWTRRLLAPAP